MYLLFILRNLFYFFNTKVYQTKKCRQILIKINLNNHGHNSKRRHDIKLTDFLNRLLNRPADFQITNIILYFVIVEIQKMLFFYGLQV